MKKLTLLISLLISVNAFSSATAGFQGVIEKYILKGLLGKVRNAGISNTEVRNSRAIMSQITDLNRANDEVLDLFKGVEGVEGLVSVKIISRAHDMFRVEVLPLTEEGVSLIGRRQLKEIVTREPGGAQFLKSNPIEVDEKTGGIVWMVTNAGTPKHEMMGRIFHGIIIEAKIAADRI